MARNLKKDYLRKLQDVKTKNGYVVDLVNYCYNFSHWHEYPNLSKVVDEDNDFYYISSVFYFKYYDGTGKYFKVTHKRPKSEKSSCYIEVDRQETELEANNRFNLNKLIQYAEQF